MRNVIGQYVGFCQMGESRSFMSWYPLSRKTWPKLFNSGHAVWHAEHGSPYFRANAGIARTLPPGRGSAEAERLSARMTAKRRSPRKSDNASHKMLFFAKCLARSPISPPEYWLPITLLLEDRD